MACSVCGSWFLVRRDVYHDLFVCSWWFVGWLGVHHGDRGAGLVLWATAVAEGGVVAVWDRFEPAGGFVLLVVRCRCFCGGSFCFVSWCLRYFCAVGAFCVFSCFLVGLR